MGSISCFDVVVDPGGPSTFVGGPIKAYATPIRGGDIYTGVASAVGAKTIKIVFASWALSVGEYEIQVVATPPGLLPQTVLKEVWQTLRSLGPA
jgi:hypothetical protein